MQQAEGNSFVTLDLHNPVAALQRGLVLESEALPAAFAVREVAPTLKEVGLRHLTISFSQNGGLILECLVPSALQYEHEPTHQISVALRRAASTAGGWVETVDFTSADAE